MSYRAKTKRALGESDRVGDKDARSTHRGALSLRIDGSDNMIGDFL